MRSSYVAGSQDRVYSYRCARIENVETTSCYWASPANTYRQAASINPNVGANIVIRGAGSDPGERGGQTCKQTKETCSFRWSQRGTSIRSLARSLITPTSSRSPTAQAFARGLPGPTVTAPGPPTSARFVTPQNDGGCSPSAFFFGGYMIWPGFVPLGYAM